MDRRRSLRRNRRSRIRNRQPRFDNRTRPEDWLAPSLMARYPNRYSRRQLRTLQRRVRQWRIVVAKQLVYASAEQSEVNEANLGNITPVSDN